MYDGRTAEPAQFKRITIPLIRRIYPQLIVGNVVAVQPLMSSFNLQRYIQGSSPNKEKANWKTEGF